MFIRASLNMFVCHNPTNPITSYILDYCDKIENFGILYLCHIFFYFFIFCVSHKEEALFSVFPLKERDF